MRKVFLALAGLALFWSSACSNSTNAPSTSFAAPQASGPANGANFKFVQQPVTLTITNSVRTSPSATVTYIVEVATDQAFANQVYSKSGIAEGSGSTTSVTLDPLTGSNSGPTTYYWHWKAVVDGVTGAPSPAQSFVVAAKVVLSAPVAVSPASGSTATVARPTFTVQNAAFTGVPGPISYEFQVSTSSSFSPLTADVTVPQGNGGQTSWTPSVDLPTTNLFWRVRASDTSNSVTSNFNTPTTFVVQLFSPSQATFYDNPPDVASWPQTATITSIVFTDSAFDVDFDKRTGPDAWIEAGFGAGGIQYTLGMCLQVNGAWACSAPVQFWAGRDLEASGPPDLVAVNWFYDGRWGPLQGQQPAIGQPVALWVGHGNLRDSGNTYRERSNFVVVPWGTSYTAN